MYNNIELSEKNKYKTAWMSGLEGVSKTALPVFNYLKPLLSKNTKILDIGCGNGMVVELLRQEGYNCYGVDITLEGLNNHVSKIQYYKDIDFKIHKEYYIQAPIWNLPFKDNEFDFTFSTDVLEHVPPELIKPSITEIFRITKNNTLHCIATFRDKRGGYEFHLTINPIEWWKKQFKKYNIDSKKYILYDRKDMLNG